MRFRKLLLLGALLGTTSHVLADTCEATYQNFPFSQAIIRAYTGLTCVYGPNGAAVYQREGEFRTVSGPWILTSPPFTEAKHVCQSDDVNRCVFKYIPH